MLDTAAVSYQIILTKSDEPKKGELADIVAKNAGSHRQTACRLSRDHR